MPKICYTPKEFRAATLAVIKQANAILDEYSDQGFVLTLRQLYYQFVARGLIPNKQNEYNRLGEIVSAARLAGLIDWDYLEDRTREVREVSHWRSPESIVEAVADQYRIDKWKDQPTRPEVWIEKDALVGVFEDTCKEQDVGLLSCRGYTSQSEMWRSAMRFIKHMKSTEQKILILHFGDHDPSGIDMSRDIEDRIRLFLNAHGYGDRFDFKRIALNHNQIEEFEPPPNPAKETDSRFQAYRDLHGDESWELDALEPAVLTALVRDEIALVRDDDLYSEAQDKEDEDRRQLTSVSEKWEKVIEFVDLEDEKEK